MLTRISTSFPREDPDALAERDPALFELIRRAYPKVTTSV
jgi:hypothetical protein